MNRILLSIAALAVLASTSCKKKSTDSTPLQSGRVSYFNGYYNQPLSFYLGIDSNIVNGQAYGATSKYYSTVQGTKTIIVTKSGSLSQAYSQPQSIGPNQTYTFFASQGTDASKVEGLFVTDSLGKSVTTGQAYIRFVQLVQTPSGTGYSLSDSGSALGIVPGIPNNRVFKSYTSFKQITPGSHTFILLDPNNNPLSNKVKSTLVANRFYTLVSTGDPSVASNAGISFLIYENIY